MTDLDKRDSARQRRIVLGATGLLIVVLVVAYVVGRSIFVRSEALEPTIPEVDSTRLVLDPMIGNPDAPVTLVEFGAYSCPSCEAWHEAGVVDQLLAIYGDDIRFVFRDLPIISPEYDRMAAELAQCAFDQDLAGDADGTLFWAFHDALFRQTAPGDSLDTLISVGEGVGLDGAALRTCKEAGTHTRTLDYDEARARRLGVRGTPVFLVNDQIVYNPAPEVLGEAIDEALAE